LEESIGEGALAVVDVGDDGEVTYLYGLFGHGRRMVGRRRGGCGRVGFDGGAESDAGQDARTRREERWGVWGSASPVRLYA
jgi:hypothetical protein